LNFALFKISLDFGTLFNSFDQYFITLSFNLAVLLKQPNVINPFFRAGEEISFLILE